ASKEVTAGEVELELAVNDVIGQMSVVGSRLVTLRVPIASAAISNDIRSLCLAITASIRWIRLRRHGWVAPAAEKECKPQVSGTPDTSTKSMIQFSWMRWNVS